MAAKSTFGNMVLVLSGICLVCSALLGTVYAVTKAPIEACSRLRKTRGSQPSSRSFPEPIAAAADRQDATPSPRMW